MINLDEIEIESAGLRTDDIKAFRKLADSPILQSYMDYYKSKQAIKPLREAVRDLCAIVYELRLEIKNLKDTK